MEERSNKFVLNNLDFIHLRGWAILGVLVIHATGPAIALMAHPIPSLYPAIVLNQLSRFCVPMFFFISAYLYTLKYDNSFNYPDFITRRLKTIGIPYLAWSFIYLTMRIMTGSIPLSEVNAQFIADTILRGTAYGHLYFVPAVFQFYILLPIIIKFWKRLRTSKFQSIILLSCFCLALIMYQLRITNLGSDAGHFLISGDFFLIWWLPFIIFGVEWASRNIDPIFINKPFFFISLIVCFSLMNYEFIAQYNQWNYYYSSKMVGVPWGEMATFLRPSAFLYAILTLSFLIYAVHNRKIHVAGIDIVGKYSFGIYLIHPLINKCVISVLKIIHLAYSPWIILIAGTILSVSVVYVLTKIRGMALIIGQTR